MTTHLVDTNIIIRWLIDDDKRKSQAFAELLKRAREGKLTLFVSDISIAETVWVLDSVYKVTLDDITKCVRNILGEKGMTFENKDRLLVALTLWENHRVDFIDAYQAALAQEKKVDKVLSYDTHYDRIPGVKRFGPYLGSYSDI